ncbi:MAG: hypothetical protein M3Q71_15970 [Chloroflexota bacterium]|nr:hypothetical protein [Chloroflexota bacterium]
MNTVSHDSPQRTSSDSRSLRDRVRGTTTPPTPTPSPKRPLRQVEPAHLQLAILATEACAERFFNEMAATPHGLMNFDKPRFGDALQEAVQEAVNRAWRDHPAIRARVPTMPNNRRAPMERVSIAAERVS